MTRGKTRIPAEDDDGTRYVYLELPRCPQCDSSDLRTYKTIRNGDGSVNRYTECQMCEQRFIVVAE